MKRTALVTGAGSGIGRAVALRLAADGWEVALVGRRADPLEATIALPAREDQKRLVSFPCDIGRAAAVQGMADQVAARFGQIDALVNAAAVNPPRRSFEVLTLEEYTRLLATNLHGAYYCAQAVLPAMRRRGSGTIVNINSEAGPAGPPPSGPPPRGGGMGE